jgi:hypothetical protein
MGEANREALDSLRSIKDERTYFNGGSRHSPQKSIINDDEEEETDKERHIRELREKYNNLMKTKLERKASMNQMSNSHR